MAKVTEIIEHDWLAVRVTFDDKSKVNVTWNRGGENVLLTPHESARAETVSNIVAETKAKMGKDGYPFKNFGEIAKAMANAGRAAKTIDDYIDLMKKSLRVTGERPKPKGAASAPKATEATSKKSHGGHEITVRFPNGESAKLKINASSVGLALDPNVTSKWKEIADMVFAAKSAGFRVGEDMANAVTEAGASADGIDSWIENMRAALFAPAPKAR